MLISAAWLRPISHSSDESSDGALDYNLVLNAELNDCDVELLGPILARHNLEMKKDQDLWIIFKK